MSKTVFPDAGGILRVFDTWGLTIPWGNRLSVKPLYAVGACIVGLSDVIALVFRRVLFTDMEDTLTQLLAGLSKPSRRFRQMTVRISDREFMELQSYAATRYLNYSDVVRAAIAAFLTSANTKA